MKQIGLLLIVAVASLAAVAALGQQTQVYRLEEGAADGGAAPAGQAVAAPQVFSPPAQTAAPSPPPNAPQMVVVPGQPSGPPGVQPNVASSPIQRISLPDKYAILLIKSIFDRAGVATPTGGPGGIGGPGGAAMGAEGQLALRGVAHDNGEFVALIEDTAAQHTIQLKPGQAVGTGRVKQIDLASIQYEAGGKTRRINVGENLMGMKLPPTSQPSHAGPPGPMPPGAGPPGANGPGQPMPGPPPGNPAMVQEMKARHRRGG